MFRPLSSVLHEKGRGRKWTWPLRPLRSNLGGPPQPPLRIKSLGKLAPADCQASRRGPRLVPFSPEPPALSGGEGLAQEIPRDRKREKEEEKLRCGRSALARAQCLGLAIP